MWEALAGHEEQIQDWISGAGKTGRALTLVKVEELLARLGVRFRTGHCTGSRLSSAVTGQGYLVRVNDGEPGVECQIDFALRGTIRDPKTCSSFREFVRRSDVASPEIFGPSSGSGCGVA